MAENKCPECGAPLDPGACECKFCGEKIAVQQLQPQQYSQQPQQGMYAQQPQQGMYAQQPQTPQPQVIIQQVAPQQMYFTGINPAWPIKSKLVAALLAFFLGGIGVHKFYLGQTGTGVVYLLFCWTAIPAFISFFEAIIYLCSSDENFQLKNHVRIQ